MKNKKPSLQNQQRKSTKAQTVKKHTDNDFKNQHSKTKEKSVFVKNKNALYIYGVHPVRAALQNKNRNINEITATKEALQEFPEVFKSDSKITVSIVDKKIIDSMFESYTVHQGIVAETSPLPAVHIDTWIESIQHKDKSTVIILDQVSDPHNVGAILRTAALFNADCVIVLDKNAPDETGSLAKAACGALEKIPYIKVSNLKRCLEKLQKNHYWCVGFSGNASQSLENFTPAAKTAIVMGAEGSGLRRLTEESCDELLSISMLGSDKILNSLNVSTAAAIALYDITNKQN